MPWYARTRMRGNPGNLPISGIWPTRKYRATTRFCFAGIVTHGKQGKTRAIGLDLLLRACFGAGIKKAPFRVPFG
jgi:hypothetical protein